jgi:aspartyl-tRNA(Asn)/glutamyl-tRNA(Gln) amidotransferase subunit C
MISEDQVKHIAKLARLGLTELEIKKFQKELSLILDYIEKLKEVDISKSGFFEHALDTKDEMRQDQSNEKTKVDNKKLIDQAPQEKAGYVKVKQIL